jgi:hypothetical protein
MGAGIGTGGAAGVTGAAGIEVGIAGGGTGGGVPRSTAHGGGGAAGGYWGDSCIQGYCTPAECGVAV